MKGEFILIVLRNDILSRLKAAGYSTYRIRQERLIPEATLQSIRHGSHITTDTINTLCNMLQCQPGDLFFHVYDPEELKKEYDGQTVKIEDD